MSNKNLQVIESVNGTQLAHYANRDVVRELMERVMMFHPVLAKLGKSNPSLAQEVGLKVAQLSILMGASPLPGLNEIHIYDDGRAEVGINYWQRRGDQKGGVLWDFESRPMTRQERENFGVEQGSLAAICRGVPLDRVRELRGLGIGINDIIKGQSITGIGVAPQSERAKNGRPPIWTAIKRAKTDFYKTAFPYIPGETLVIAGAGMRKTEGGYEPDFSAFEWRQLEAQENQRFGPDWGDTAEDGETEVVAEFEDAAPADDVAPHLVILERLQTAVHPNKTAPASQKQLNFLHAALSRVFDNDGDKKALLASVFPECEDEEGHISSKCLSIGQASVLIEWLNARPPDYAVSDEAKAEACIIVNAVQAEAE